MKKWLIGLMLILLVPVVLAGTYGARTYSLRLYGIGEGDVVIEDIIDGTTDGGESAAKTEEITHQKFVTPYYDIMIDGIKASYLEEEIINLNIIIINKGDVPDSQRFTAPKIYPVYAWANDSDNNYHTVYNLSIDLTYIDPCIYTGSGNWDVYSYCEYTDLNFNFNKNLTLKEDATMNCTIPHCNLNCTEDNQYLVFENIETYLIKLIGNWTINQP